jgi:hypothetical protein
VLWKQHAATPFAESGIQSTDEKFLTDRSGAGDASLWVCERGALAHDSSLTLGEELKNLGPPGSELVKFLIFALKLRRTVNSFHACPNFTR